MPNYDRRGLRPLKLQWNSKQPLHIFKVSFESTEYVKPIHGIKHILNTTVQAQPMKQQKLVPQCGKCQSFGHMKNNNVSIKLKHNS